MLAASCITSVLVGQPELLGALKHNPRPGEPRRHSLDARAPATDETRKLDRSPRRRGRPRGAPVHDEAYDLIHRLSRWPAAPGQPDRLERVCPSPSAAAEPAQQRARGLGLTSLGRRGAAVMPRCRARAAAPLMRSGRTGTWDQLLTVTPGQARPQPRAAERRKLRARRSSSPNPDQPRQFFDAARRSPSSSASITAHGVLQPILVRPHPRRSGPAQIVAGERRWLRRPKQAGLMRRARRGARHQRPARPSSSRLVENVLREDITPLEEARSLKRLIDTFGYSYAKLGERLGKNKAYVDHRVRLLKMPDRDPRRARAPVSEPTDGKLAGPFSPRHAGVVAQLDAPRNARR